MEKVPSSVTESMKKITVFIDESGTLPDPKDKIIVVAAVATEAPETIDAIIKLVKKKGLKKQSGELKFYTAGERTKIAFFDNIAKEKFDIFILAVDKMGRKISDKPEHFALLAWLLLSDILNFSHINEIIFDRHFFRKSDTEKFNKQLSDLLGIDCDIKHVDSIKNKRINIADMVAGAVLAKETNKDPRFYEMITNRIISYKKLNWKEAKRKLFGR